MRDWTTKRFKGEIPFYNSENNIRDFFKQKAAEAEVFEKKAEEEFAALPEIPDYDPALSDEENLKNNEADYERLKSFWNKGSQESEWDKWLEAYYKKRTEFLNEFDGGSDFDWEFFVMNEHLKMQFMAFYFEHLGHCESNARKARDMRLAQSLLEIILGKGYDYDNDKLPYVNYRNAHRFQYVDTHGTRFYCRRAEVRFRKAYCLYFEWMKTHLLTWID